MKKHLLVIFLIYLFLGGCGKNVSEKLSAPQSSYYHSSYITSDETWYSNAIHFIEKDIYIQNAVVTIQPGALIQFKEGTSINVMDSGGLIAAGSYDSPIRFTHENESYWKYIYFASNAIEDSCKLLHSTFEFGGADDEWPAMIYCQCKSPQITNCEIKNSASNGVYFEGNCSANEFTANIISQNSASPIVTAACNVTNLGANVFTGNTFDCIHIIHGNLTENGIWLNYSIPYFIGDDIKINNSCLTISAGVTLKFKSQTRILVESNSQLIAIGKDQPILFTNNAQDERFWDGIYFQPSSAGQLENCVIEYGGDDSQYPATIYVNNASPQISNCVIRNGANYGIYFKGENAGAVFQNNTISDHVKAPVSVPAANMSIIYGNLFSENNDFFIELRGGPEEGQIFRESFWDNLGAPYRITDDLTVTSTTLRIAPGVTIEMSHGSSITIENGGELIADGTSQFITFTGVYKSPGSWNCLTFSNVLNSFLNNCRIEFGGGDMNKPANIFAENASPIITNCYIENSLGYGIYYIGMPNPVLDNNYYVNNQAGTVYP